MKHSRAGLLALLTLVGACQSEQPTDPTILLGDIQLTVVSGNTQVGNPGTELSVPLVARVTDAAGKKLKGMLVNFRVVSGGGSVFAGAAISDDNGLVQDYWTLGTTGSQVVEARSVNSTTGGKQTYGTFTATFPPPPPPPADVDGDGFTVTQGDCNDNDVTVNPGVVDAPDATFTDHDCDGVDGRVSDAIFVSVTGTNNIVCGTLANPCASITLGMTVAATSGRPHVYIAVGSYNEAVQLRNGVSLFGGYASNFGSRSLTNRAAITGSIQELTLGARYTVIGVGLTQPISFVALVVRAANASGQLASGAGIHSVGILLLNSSASVTITHTDIVAGNGSAGLDGVNGSSATAIAAQAGGAGGSALEIQTSCDETGRGAAGSAGGSGLLAGGAGGAGGTKDTECDDIFNLDFTARGGNSGVAAAVTSALLGTPGGSGGVCAPGGAGYDGRVSHGANGTGGGSPVVVGGLFVIASGSSGSLGLDGGGGGGGGGSGGCDLGTDSYGAGGGGGGSGGIHATSVGAGGGGGGSSIGLYLFFASATTQGVNITRGNGGNGGDGGLGGRGQPGGLGGSGGSASGDSQAGGAGGVGGTGGHSGAGGGGSGGMSVGILGVSGSTTPITGSSVAGGAAGLAGSGGARFDGLLAGNGVIGTLQSILILP